MSATVTPTLPFTFNFNQQELRIDTRTYAEGQRGDTIENVAVTPGYLAALGARVLEGRDVDATDVPGSPDVVLVNDVMARTYWPNTSAVSARPAMSSTTGAWAVLAAIFIPWFRRPRRPPRSRIRRSR